MRKGRHRGYGRESVGTDRPGRKGSRSGISFFLKQQNKTKQNSGFEQKSTALFGFESPSLLHLKVSLGLGNLSDATESTAALTWFCDFFGGCWFTPLWRLTLDAVKTGCS